MQKFINVDPLDPAALPEHIGLLDEEAAIGTPAAQEEELSMNPMTGMAQFEVSDRASSTDGGYTAPAVVPPPASTTRTREQRAMKEPKSLKK